jgi:hypothetical protein
MLFATATTTLNKLNIGVADTVMTSGGTSPRWSPELTIAKSIALTGAGITTGSTAQSTLFDTNSKAVSIGGAATSVAIGSATASEAFTSNVKSYTTGGSSSVVVTASIGLTSVISTVARNGSNVATITTVANHGLTNGDMITVVCTSDAGFNAVQTAATVTGLTTFTYADTGSVVSTVAGTGSVFIGGVGMTLGSTTVNADPYLRFSTNPITAGVRVGMLVQGNTFIPAGTTVTGVDAGRVYLSAAVTGIISSGVPIAFTDTNTSMGIKPGDQVTVASSGVTNINGTWPVTSAGATSTTFSFKITSATTQTNLARAGTIVKESTLLIRNRNLTIGSSEASASPVSAVIKGENAVGTNIAGANITIKAGQSTGNSVASTTAGSIIFQTGATGSSGDTTQAATTRLTIGQSASTTLDLVTAMTTANVFNTNATTVNFAGASTILAIANTGTNARTVNIATAATGGASTLNFGGAVTGNTIEINGVAAGTVNITSDVTTGIVNLVTGVTTGTVNLATGGASTINLGDASSNVRVGTLNIGNATYESTSETVSITSASATAVSSFAAATYRSAKYILQVTCTAGTDNATYQVSEILVIHNGTTATMTDYGVVKTGANNLVTFTADISGGNVRLLAQATAGNTIKVRVVRTLNTI